MAHSFYSLVRHEVERASERSAWARGVKAYALELVETLEESHEWNNGELPATRGEVERRILNGAVDWMQYSEGGCSLVYDQDIAERLCNASELKKTKNGEKNPNNRENWIQCQARALYQASILVCDAVKKVWTR